jgi:hypothetical protein
VVRSSTYEEARVGQSRLGGEREKTYEFEVSFVNEGAGEVGERRSSTGAASGSVKTRHAMSGRERYSKSRETTHKMKRGEEMKGGKAAMRRDAVTRWSEAG